MSILCCSTISTSFTSASSDRLLSFFYQPLLLDMIILVPTSYVVEWTFYFFRKFKCPLRNTLLVTLPCSLLKEAEKCEVGPAKEDWCGYQEPAVDGTKPGGDGCPSGSFAAETLGGGAGFRGRHWCCDKVLWLLFGSIWSREPHRKVSSIVNIF